MTTVRAQLFISLDGVVEAPERWHFPWVDEVMMAAVQSHFVDARALLLGRTTFEIFASSWPERPRDTVLSQRINSMPKLVASARPELPHWENSSVLSGDLASSIAAARSDSAAPIAVAGSVRLVRSLLRLRLLDELQLLIHPVVLGKGERLFADSGPGAGPIPMRLDSAVVFPSGVIDTRYIPDVGDAGNR